MLLPVVLHPLAKEMIRSFWMMWAVLVMKESYWTANTLPIITVVTFKMLVLYATEHVRNNLDK